jgi:hypothetical protein
MTVDTSGAFVPLAGEPNPFVADIPQPRERHLWKVPMDIVGHKNEAELVQRVLARLEPWFLIEEQVEGQHFTGKTLRIDAIIRPRQPELWHNPQTALGLEFKTFNSRDRETSVKDITGLAAQAIDYTHVDWPGYGQVPVFTCPSAFQWSDSSRDVGDFDRGGQMYRHLLGQLSIGELLLYWGSGLTLLLNGNPIWTERKGVIHGKHWSLKVRTGSR